MKKKLFILVASGFVILGSSFFAWHWIQGFSQNPDIVLYGNIDFRKAYIAFNNTERVSEILVEEGSKVDAGQILARLDNTILKAKRDQARSEVTEQEAILLELKNGNRPEEIAQARASLASASADVKNMSLQYERKKKLISTSAVSQQDLDSTKAAFDVAVAKERIAKHALELQILGPRTEAISQAEARLNNSRARLAIAEQQLEDAILKAPFPGIIRSRLVEPGEMVSPSKPAFTIASSGTKWIRSYVKEQDLGRIYEGTSG